MLAERGRRALYREVQPVEFAFQGETIVISCLRNLGCIANRVGAAVNG